MVKEIEIRNRGNRNRNLSAFSEPRFAASMVGVFALIIAVFGVSVFALNVGGAFSATNNHVVRLFIDPSDTGFYIEVVVADGEKFGYSLIDIVEQAAAEGIIITIAENIEFVGWTYDIGRMYAHDADSPVVRSMYLFAHIIAV